ncbi:MULTISPECIES: molybdate ABC transporter permease subunit [Rhodanobacter]|uniref:Molybdenum transport system permease n=1 Tax=Rhodanobacter denitrificans TaxID=666685 RepID=I4WYL3_9GAMM|nr:MULTISPECIES: molybdate ABC transporter permease subunit [Rhodanobacter]AGG89965.1 molybdate ABC transporter, permease protein [Rhodanobacter denitrificans]EIM04555.1 molybdate transport system permease [Rhodanobacter denitrificans]KZC21783.1 molybdenum ABC transporter permease subunit [Rhodanobacter denitrificans]UJJ50082.1 molybdate ABC transporter permease subunit [Rhodanobacter denitrificans]UJJ57726.1 molybdate ABC transporter permease subunit [Rhodanobacter denitrificans]
MTTLQAAILVTLKLAGLTTLILLLLGMPLAWWLARSRSRWRMPVGALVALPMVLPPTVLGFYLLLGMGPDGPLGQLTTALGLGTLAFTFQGLLLASVLYSLPFVVHPLQSGFAAIEASVLEAAATLRASPFDRFISVVLPLSKPALVTATLFGFAHTVGEFGVVLMVGGNIDGQTRVLSVLLYDQVEAMAYADAHRLAAGLLAFSFGMLLVVQWLGRRTALAHD